MQTAEDLRVDNSFNVVTISWDYVVVEGVTISEGHASTGFSVTGYGAGVRCTGELPTFRNCTFKHNCATVAGGAFSYNWECTKPMFVGCRFVENTAAHGGAVDISDGTIIDCKFQQNNATSYGGAVSASHSDGLYIHNSIFTRNAAGGLGGALHSYDDTIRVTDCTFVENTAEQRGGAISIGGYGRYQDVRRCIFVRNEAHELGGAVYDTGGGTTGTRKFRECFFVGNRISAEDPASGKGGAGARSWYYDCVFVGNQSNGKGGALYFPQPVNCTITENFAHLGGGIYGGTTTAGKNLTVWGNTHDGEDDWSAQIFLESFPMTVQFSCIQGIDPLLSRGNIADDPHFLSGVQGELDKGASYDPAQGITTLVVNEASLRNGELAGQILNLLGTRLYSLILDNTELSITVLGDLTHAAMPGAAYRTIDVHLGEGSPCINAGDPNWIGEEGAADIDGELRRGDCRVDMGADESTYDAQDCNGNGIADACEFQEVADYQWPRCVLEAPGSALDLPLINFREAISDVKLEIDLKAYVNADPDTWIDIKLDDIILDTIGPSLTRCLVKRRIHYIPAATFNAAASDGSVALRVEPHGIIPIIERDCFSRMDVSATHRVSRLARDCDRDSIPDECSVPPLQPDARDCNENQQPDSCDINGNEAVAFVSDRFSDSSLDSDFWVASYGATVSSRYAVSRPASLVISVGLFGWVRSRECDLSTTSAAQIQYYSRCSPSCGTLVTELWDGDSWEVIATQTGGGTTTTDWAFQGLKVPQHLLTATFALQLRVEGSGSGGWYVDDLTLSPVVGPGEYVPDGLTDLHDFKGLSACLTGPVFGSSAAQDECSKICLLAFDADSDGDADLRDVADLTRRVSGP